ncbi:HET-domain-containing protein [Alternaria alternata]|nr:HET-domain-containing protein [Alternaria alternata]
MSLCNLCQSFDILDFPKLSPDYTVYPVTSKAYPSLVSNIHKLRSSRWKTDRGDLPHNSEPLGLPYHQSVEALEAAVANNCAVCTVVQRDVAQFKTEFAEAKEDTSVYMERSGGPSWKMFAVRAMSETGGFMIVSADTKAPFQIWIVAAVGLCVDCKLCLKLRHVSIKLTVFQTTVRSPALSADERSFLTLSTYFGML